MSSGKIEGTGIGLAVTKELVKLLGGHINVNSKPSIGTTFEVRLPISQVVEKTALEPSRSVVIETTSDQIATPVTKESKSNPLVLLVEDNPDVVKYLVSCLNEDYQLEVAYDGQDGMDRAINLTPDIIISDVMMPKKNGFELAKILKNDERCSHIPIILLTAKADMESRIEGLEQGADAYLTKPFHKAELLVRIRKLLELRKNLQAYYLSFATDKGIKEKSIDTFAEITTEHLFVKKVRAAIEENLGDYKLNVDKLCKMMAMSQSQLNRKLNALTGYSANKFIRIIRLQKASKLLRETEDTISSIAYDTGFNDPDYFSRLFRREFKQTPSTFRKQKS